MKRFFIALGILSIALYSCESSTSEQGDKQNETKNRDARGGVVYGGVITINSTESYSSLFPLEVTDAYSNLVINNVYEGLMRINKENLEVEGSLAEEVSTNEAADEFVFKLRKGVKFHDDPCFEGGKGRELTADDVVFCFTNACKNFEQNNQADFLINKIEGAKDFYDGKADQVSGITKVDEHTIKIKLIKAFAGFDKLLTHAGFSIYPKEAFEKYGAEMKEHMVGTGPFQQEKLDNGNLVTLKKNANYWEKDEFGNQLPYADGVSISYIKSKKEEILAFRSGKLDVLTGVPVENIDDFVGSLKDAQKNTKHRYNSLEGMNVHYLGFLGTDEIFNNVNLRKAFAHAIDKNTLVEIDLDGDASIALNGFVPPMTEYEEEKIKQAKFDVALAKKLLAKSGVSASKISGTTLYYNSSDNKQEIIAKAIQRDLLRNLNIKIEVVPNSMRDHNDIVSNSKAKFWKLAWVADYPDPENFLNLFYGANIQDGSYLNAFKFKNAEYDRLFEEASKESDDAKRMKLLEKCDAILMENAVAIPLLHNNVELITAAKIKNCNVDAMGVIDLKNTYIKEKKEAV